MKIRRLFWFSFIAVFFFSIACGNGDKDKVKDSKNSPDGTAPCPFKPGSEPDGFRGIRWGTDISALRGQEFIKKPIWNSNKELREEIAKDDYLTFYEKKGDELKIGDSDLIRIQYGFWKNNFYAARIETNLDNIINLVQALSGKYGNCHDVLNKLYQDDIFKTVKIIGSSINFISWKGNIAEVSYLWSVIDSRLMIVNNSITDQVEAYLKDKRSMIEQKYINDNLKQEEEERQRKEIERKRQQEIEKGNVRGF